MADNKIPADVLSTIAATASPDARPRPSLMSRVQARLRAEHFDRQLAVGVPAPAGSALAAHEARLTSTAEREAIARSLRAAVADSAGIRALSSRIPVHSTNIAAAEDLIDAITLRLHSPRPVSARGMARLRLVLGDGTGPLYRYGRGDLAGRLGAALAAL
ncbi:hypothetical protein H7J93_03760 [Mycobacterium barrassiae]|uniref:hypothetical protein n=1 Tax=Mycobacterium barrassiae TaxID=319709 RepID=UPI002265F598|nr:hypothetical protein [Mycobacterium barrassiae]MCV7298748.1 hypothetical protein [Mycobacterium barrassiae]